MKNILKIQELEAKIKSLGQNSEKSAENQLYDRLKESRKVLLDSFNTIDKNAETLAKQFNQIAKKYEQLNAKSEITAKQKPEMMGVSNIGALVEDANYLTSELAKLEQKMRELNKNINDNLAQYNRAYAELKDVTIKMTSMKKTLDVQKANVLPKIQELEEEIKKLEPKADKELYAKYKSMRADKIFPVFVHLSGNRCGNNRCRLEQSLSFIENLKKSRMLPCENCRSIIIIDD